MITVVTGLPRSGTSLTMQMLRAGGYPILYDKEPNCDLNNPRGYYEWKSANKLHGEDNRDATRDSNLALADGKCVKIFTFAFFAFSPMFDYQFIYVDRNIDQVQKSHVAFFERLGKNKTAASADKLYEIRWHGMIYIKSFRHLILRHKDLYDGSAAEKIDEFLSNFRPREASELLAMQSCVDESLLHFK